MMSLYSYLPVAVWDSDLRVVRETVRYVSPRSRRNPRLRGERKRLYRDMLAAHHAQQHLCAHHQL